MKVIYGQQYLKELHLNKKTTDKRYEKLLGNKQGVSSVRVNDKYRIVKPL
jgi:plasmid maintenance system killer protein